MIVRLFFFLLFFPFAFSGFSQNENFGLKAGFNVSTVGGDAQDAHLKLGIHGGISSKTALSEYISLRAEILLSDQGTRSKDGFRASYKYINLPFLIQFERHQETKFYFGGQLGALYSAKTKDNKSRKTENITAQLSNYDLSVVLGFNFPINESFSIDTRYNHGMIDYSGDDDAQVIGKFYNRVFQISCIYHLKRSNS